MGLYHCKAREEWGRRVEEESLYISMYISLFHLVDSLLKGKIYFIPHVVDPDIRHTVLVKFSPYPIQWGIRAYHTRVQ